MFAEPPAKRATPIVLLGHWYILIEKLQASPQELYRRVEQALADRQVPELEVMRVTRYEGGPLSAKREYLRLVRQRMVFDICGAPFGTGFFVSWRMGELPLSINPLWVLMLLIALGAFVQFRAELPPYYADVGIAVLVLALVLFFIRRTMSRGIADLDSMLLKIPIIGELYGRYLRRITYYRIDQMLMYQQAVHAAVNEILDEMTKSQSLEPLSEFQRKPILKDFCNR